MTESLEDLRRYLATILPGDISDDPEVERLLEGCWDKLASDEGGMRARKLLGRTEQVRWKPPELHFVIERHGWTVLGSTRAELQRWTVNVDSGTASLNPISGHRQLSPMSPRLNVQPLAEDIARLIVNRTHDDRLKWYEDGHVRVNIGEIVPADAVAQTLLGRRRRFRKKLTELLAAQGWRELRANVYVPSDTRKQI